MFDNMSQQKRTIIAVVLAIVFFIVYDYFVPKPAINTETKETTTTQIQSKNNNNVQVIAKNTSKTIATIKSEHFTASVNEFGEISSFILEDKRFLAEDNKAINLVDQNATLLPLTMSFYDTKFNDEFNKIPFTANKSEVGVNDDLILSKNVDGINIEKIIRFNDNGFYTVKVLFSDNKDKKFVISAGQRPNVLADNYTVHGAMVYKNDDTKVEYKDDSIKNNEDITENNVNIAAFSDRYYTSVLYNFSKPFTVVLKNSSNNESVGYVIAESSSEFNGYIGPKEHKILEAVNEKLANVVEYGWFTFIAKPMFAFLSFLHKHITNWGWSIVVLTIIIRIILFPLTYKSMVSMQKLKVLAPKIKEIQEKYKGNPQKMQAHMMELYKKHKANPLGGCLPILIQIPIFFAIYRVLLNAIELKAAPWALWIHDLAAHDPYYILPIYMGITMFLQQVITPMNIQDPTQAKIMKFLPLIFVFFFINFPAGLTLYWCVNNTFSLAQQLFINKIFAKKEAKHEVY